MPFRVRMTAAAERQLGEILDYIERDFANPDYASTVMDAIDDCLAVLKARPFVFRECTDPRLAARGFRRAIAARHVVVFRVSELEKLVVVHGIFFATMDYAELV